MQSIRLLIITIFMLTFWGCSKQNSNQQIIPIPNGDFELWDDMPNLHSWQTNSCPACVPLYETYIVKKVTDVAHGQFAAKFVYNNVYNSFAINKFAVSQRPTVLTGYLKSNIANGDTAIIHIGLFSGANRVAEGNLYETGSHAAYRKITISLPQTSLAVDSAFIKIVGGKKQNTELYVDNLVFVTNG